MGQQRALETLIKQVGYRTDYHPAFVFANEIMPIEDLIALAVAELNELAEEHDKLDGNAPHKDFVMEFTDYVVVLRSIILRYAEKLSLESMLLSVNGQFQGNFNSLTSQTLNITEGNVYRNLQFLFTELLSLAKHTGLEIQAELFAGLMNERLENNRPSKYFQLEPRMSEQDILNKRDHAFQVLRKIRNFLKKLAGKDVELKPWIVNFFDEELKDWRNSTAVLEVLEQRILAFQNQIRDELSWALMNPATAENPDPDLEIKMLIAGAVSLKPMQ